MIDWRRIDDDQVIGVDLQEATIERHGERHCGYSIETKYFDFEYYGKEFTQVAIVVQPDKPVQIDGRNVVVVASEGGNDNGQEFLTDLSGREAIGPWLAARGITFVALCRLGRWNFLTEKPFGSWVDVPLNERMPVFSRSQKQHWGASDYDVIPANGVSSPTGSTTCRMPHEGSALYDHMMALTPATVLEGFSLARNNLLGANGRKAALKFYWGFSTGGAYMWAFAKKEPPTGVLGYGMTGIPFTRYSIAAAEGRYTWLYDRSTFRVRERGRADFEFYNGHLPQDVRDRLYEVSLRSPRFKSYEDTFMFFNIASQIEALSRLWNSSFLPESVRARGFTELMRENIEYAYPDRRLESVVVLDLYGTEDEVRRTSKTPWAIGGATKGYCRKYKVVLLDGRHHSIDADHSQAFGAIWLDAIHARFFS